MKVYDKVVTKNIIFNNRIIMPPMASSFAENNGYATQEILDYYHEKTRHGIFSAVIVEHCYIDVVGKAHIKQLGVDSDFCIDGLSKLARVIKNNGSLAILQISHAGSSTTSIVTGKEPVAPSRILNPTERVNSLPRELRRREVEDLVEKFIEAAVRAKEAGFDGVELHSAHGYLLNQFLSPLTNKRDDEYGGDIKSRIKIHLDIIKGIRERLGDMFPIFFRIGACDFNDKGLSIDDSVIACKELEKVGVDVIDISGGMCSFRIDDTRAGYFDILSEPIFNEIKIPVILTGGIITGKDIELVLSKNVCDLVGVGRAVYKDSNWIKREVVPLFI